MAARLPNILFESVKTRKVEDKLDGVEFVMAEAKESAREHRRILAVAPGDSDLDGKPIAYSDAYLDHPNRTYVYARHKWSAESFFLGLDAFLEKNFAEWSNRAFPIILNNQGERLKLELMMPFEKTVPYQPAIQFAKVFLPFGPIAIEFGIPHVTGDELANLRRERLTRLIETPLVGCDVTETPLPSTLIAEGHWASRQIPLATLNSLLLQAAPVFV